MNSKESRTMRVCGKNRNRKNHMNGFIRKGGGAERKKEKRVDNISMVKGKKRVRYKWPNDTGMHEMG